MTAPDFAALRAASTEAIDLAREGKLTREDFDRLFERAHAAVGSQSQLLEGMLMLGLEHGFVNRSD